MMSVNETEQLFENKNLVVHFLLSIRNIVTKIVVIINSCYKNSDIQKNPQITSS